MWALAIPVAAAGVFTLPNVTTGSAGTIHDGSHTVTAAFTAAAAPTSAVKSFTDAVGASLTIQGASSENLTVNIGAEEGAFTYTVGSGTVSLAPQTGTGYDALGHNGTFGSGTFTYVAAINPVTVNDLRVAEQARLVRQRRRE